MNLSIRGNAELPVILSKREIDIIKHIADGLNSAEIAIGCLSPNQP
jgi:DNA-binding CsgD family transcriptional regulator